MIEIQSVTSESNHRDVFTVSEKHKSELEDTRTWSMRTFYIYITILVSQITKLPLVCVYCIFSATATMWRVRPADV